MAHFSSKRFKLIDTVKLYAIRGKHHGRPQNYLFVMWRMSIAVRITKSLLDFFCCL
jgi:hypothetical protein